MSILSILLPDFLLIVLGFVLYRRAGWGLEFWTGLEKLVYFVLFPSLLFYATSRTPFDFSQSGRLLQTALLTTAAGIALGWLAKPLFKVGPMVFESAVQTAFRFNSYIALAVASRLAGDAGTALMALIIGFAVPICNMAAVHALAHRKGGLGMALAKNPLLVATVSGVLCNLAGLHLPEIANATLSRLGNASIALGLITVGAGLRGNDTARPNGIAAYFIGVKLLVLPAIAYFVGRWLQLPPLHLQLAVMFCALPTASSAYVLAARMGGDGPFVAWLVSAGTVASAVTLPLWLLLVT
ncbi:MAG: AEC family transporter [Herminiimonas sp.]|nr:AEC family transporter [Herminiimonas sp.]